MGLSKSLADGLEKLGWSFNPQAELNRQWVKDLGFGQVHQQGGDVWLSDFNIVQTKLFKEHVGYKASALTV